MATETHKWICGAGDRGVIAAGLCLLIGLTTTGCASAPGSASQNKNQAQNRAQNQVVSKSADARRLKALRLKRERLQDLKERRLVLDTRKQLNEGSMPEIADAEKPAALPNSFSNESLSADEYAGGESIASSAPTLAPKPEARTEARAEPLIPTSSSNEKTGEQFLYSKILETYRSRNDVELQKALQLLLKTYPESVFADNAIYLAGLLAFESGNTRMAEKRFDQLLKEYPRSNKAVSALFAKAAIEKRSGRVGNARRSFLRVKNLYPGSPEAARVSVELKLLESAKLKSRES